MNETDVKEPSAETRTAATPDKGNGIPETAKWLVTPVPGDSPCGEDPKYNTEFDAAKSQLEKTGGVDYGVVLDNSRKILSEQAKDLRVLGYYLLAAAKEEGIAPFCHGVAAYRYFLENHWEDVHPRRESARINAFKWLNQDRVVGIIGKLEVGADNGRDLASAAEALNAMKNLINVKFVDNPPSIGNLVKLISGWAVKNKPSGEAPQPAAPAPQAETREREGSRETPSESTPSAAENSAVQEGAGAPQAAKPVVNEDSELVKQLTAPISENSACGEEDPKYSTEFDTVKSEIEKSGGADYELISNTCLEILTGQAKDLRVLGFFMLASAKTGGIPQFCDAATAYSRLIQEHLEEIHPLREAAKLNAVKWLNQDRLHGLLNQLKVSPDYHEQLKEAQTGLHAVKNLVNEQYKDSPPSIGGLLKIVDRWVRESKPKEAKPKAAPSPAAAAASASASTGAPFTGTQGSGPSVPRELADQGAARLALQETAHFYLKNDISNPIGYRLMRIAKWQQIVKPPVTQDGKLKIPGPNPRQAEFFAKQLEEQNWQDLAVKGEEAFTRPGLHFWLDLQLYIHKGLEGLGHMQAADGLLEELTALVRRVPEILNIQFQDGTPFANAVTADWIQERVRQSQAGGGGGGGGSRDKKLPEDKKAAMELTGKGKLQEALTLLQQGASGFDARSAAERKLVMANLCFQSQNAIIAEGILDGLIARLDAGVLEDWEPEFCVSVYELSMKVCKSLAEQKTAAPEAKARYLMKAREAFKKVGELDPVKAAGMKIK